MSSPRAPDVRSKDTGTPEHAAPRPPEAPEPKPAFDTTPERKPEPRAHADIEEPARPSRLPAEPVTPLPRESRAVIARGARPLRRVEREEAPSGSKLMPILVIAMVALATLAVLRYALRDPKKGSSGSGDATASTVTSVVPALTTAPPATSSEPTSSASTDATEPAPTSSASAEPSATASASASASTGEVAPEDDEKKPLSWRVITALSRGKTARAYDLAVQYTQAAPNNPKAWQMRGGVEMQLGKNAKASFKRCADLAPPDSDLANECRALSQ
jgi:hypothetical protein